MVSYMQDLSGNVLAFAMSTLESLLAHHVGFDKAFDKSFLKNILPFVFLPNQTASRRVVEILTHLLKAGQHDFTAIDEAIQADAAKDGKRPYWVFVQLLSSVDLNVKLSSLTFICELINSASDEPKKRFFHLLDDLGINRVLKVSRPSFMLACKTTSTTTTTTSRTKSTQSRARSSRNFCTFTRCQLYFSCYCFVLLFLLWLLTAQVLACSPMGAASLERYHLRQK